MSGIGPSVADLPTDCDATAAAHSANRLTCSGTGQTIAARSAHNTRPITQSPVVTTRRSAAQVPRHGNHDYATGPIRSEGVVRKQAERVTVWVDHHANVVVRLMVGESRALSDRPPPAGLEVADADV